MNDKLEKVASKAETTEQPKIDDKEQLIKTLLAATDLQCTPAPKKEENSDLAKLVTILTDITNKNGGSGGGNKRKENTDFYDPHPRWKFYCSTHGVNPSHDDKDCKRRGSNSKEGATFEDKKGGSKKNLHKWHAAKKGDRVDYNS